MAPLALNRATAAAGETIIGSVTYANTTPVTITIRNIVIASRPPASGTPARPGASFTPGYGEATIPPGRQITLIATRTITEADMAGGWQAFSSYQDAAGVWHSAPPAHDAAFAVGAPVVAGTPGVAGTAATVRAAQPPPTVTASAPTPAPTALPTPLPTAPSGPSRTPVAATPRPVVGSLDTATPMYWGAYIDGVPWDLARLDAFDARAQKPSSIVHWGQAWWHDGGYQPFYPNDFDRVRARGALPLLDWGSWDYCCGPDQPAFSLDAIARGDHDAFIRQWAAGARDWGQPLFLRFNWEMNGWWQFPWSERLNGNSPGDYVRAWRHVHDLFAEVGATNVTWVWCPNVINAETTPLDTLYPGDAYVDWVAMDGYNWGNDYGNSWQSFAEIFTPTYEALRRLAPSKPIMIAEIGCQERGGDKAAWIRDALGVQLPARFPAIKAVVWFNWDDNDPTQTGAIESSPASIAAVAATVGASRNFVPNRFGNVDLSPIPPPGP